VDSSYQPLPNPKKVLILINRGCASTTEQFLLYARQSSKVILAGEPTQGVLDYSNMRDAPFSCMSYVLRYATTRSRRLDVGEGIDNIGIKPQIKLERNGDWIKQARKIIEAQ
jgi:C-terminal processing protease CtpA/Prc